jgi:hypothetical protein
VGLLDKIKKLTTKVASLETKGALQDTVSKLDVKVENLIRLIELKHPKKSH